jgi:hypothetical protein
MACSAAKTDAVDGECAPVSANLDPDAECTDQGAASCGVAGNGCNGSASAPGCLLYDAATECLAGSCTDGTETVASLCDGMGVCVPGGTTSCGAYACEAGGTSCATSCDADSQCSEGNHCDLINNECTDVLRVAIQSPLGTPCRDATDSIPALEALLVGSGHTVTVVVAADIDTLPEISAYDVVVIAGAGAGCNSGPELGAIDTNITEYVTGGGSVLSTGWMMFESELNSAPNLAALLPTIPAQGTQFTSGPGTLTPVAGHPITMGVGSFMYVDFANQGDGTRVGATTLLTQDAVEMGAAWEVGAGRAVYLAPLYVESQAAYNNENLLDNSQPDAVMLILRSIEWLGNNL